MTTRFGTMTLVAALIGVIAGVSGMYISYYAATSPGATIVMTNTVLFLLALAWNAVRSRIIARAPAQIA